MRNKKKFENCQILLTGSVNVINETLFAMWWSIEGDWSIWNDMWKGREVVNCYIILKM